VNEPGLAGMVPVVRNARSSDAEVVGNLCAAAEAAMAEFRGGDVLRGDSPVPGLDGDSPVRVWLVAEIGEHVVGMLTARREGDVLVVDRVYVEPSARAHGAGDALVAALFDSARVRGIARVDGWALPGDRETKNLYERNGMTARAIIASRMVADAPGD
jgi:GNAT superfamily N-acetyltransferase